MLFKLNRNAKTKIRVGIECRSSFNMCTYQVDLTSVIFQNFVGQNNNKYQKATERKSDGYRMLRSRTKATRTYTGS